VKRRVSSLRRWKNPPQDSTKGKKRTKKKAKKRRFLTSFGMTKGEMLKQVLAWQGKDCSMTKKQQS